jgi:hypothetical protein
MSAHPVAVIRYNAPFSAIAGELSTYGTRFADGCIKSGPPRVLLVV